MIVGVDVTRLGGAAPVGVCFRKKLCLLAAVPVALIVLAGATVVHATDRALLIGIGEYQDADYRLRGVTDDLRLIREAIVEAGMFSDNEIRTLVNEEARKVNIVSTIKSWLIDGTRTGDTVLLYFSGHGVQIWDENGDEIQDGIDEALMCWDAILTNVKTARTFRGLARYAFAITDAQNFLLDDEINAFLSRLKDRKVILVSDSCHSGSVYKRSNPFFVQNKTVDPPFRFKSVFEKRSGSTLPKAVGAETTNLGNDVKVRDATLACFTASQDSQPAEILYMDRDPTGYHSIFSWYLYHGLRGKADLDRDGKVTFGELSEFLREELTRDGYDQIPDYYFQPETLATVPVTSRVSPPRPGVIKRNEVGCFLVTDETVSDSEAKKIRSDLSMHVPFIFWTDRKEETSCLISVEKKDGTYGGRLSDASGSYWEASHGKTVPSMIKGLGSNLGAYCVQTILSRLRNDQTGMTLDLDYKVNSAQPRKPGEVVAGDKIFFECGANTAGFLLILSVDAQGMIYPLYPLKPKFTKVNAGELISIGAERPFPVRAPFGRDMILALLLNDKPDGLLPYWHRFRIGSSDTPGMNAQQQFIDALWTELAPGGRPKGVWTSRMWLIKSFKE